MYFQQFYTFKTVLFTKFLKYMLHDKYQTQHTLLPHGLLIDPEKVQFLSQLAGIFTVNVQRVDSGDVTHSVSNGLWTPPLPAAAPPMVPRHSIQQRATTPQYTFTWKTCSLHMEARAIRFQRHVLNLTRSWQLSIIFGQSDRRNVINIVKQRSTRPRKPPVTRSDDFLWQTKM
jgi:hypothetical protein